MRFKTIDAALLTLTCAVLIPVAAAVPAQGQTEPYTAKVVSVIDGDTIKIMRDGNRQTVILQGIDCPEIGQEFGAEAKKFTDDACYGKVVTIEDKGRDRHDRIIASVSLSDGTSLNQELVKQGLAWWSDKFAPNDTLLKQLHMAAKSAHKGLWASPKPIPPWLFRNGSKSVEATIKPSSK